MNRRTVPVFVAALALASLTACGGGVDTSSAQNAAASAMRLAAEGKAEDACEFAVTDWTEGHRDGVPTPGTHYARFTETTQEEKDRCISQFTQFTEDLEAAGVTGEISKVSAEELVVEGSTAGFSRVYHETLGVSTEVVELDDGWYVFDAGLSVSQ